MKHPYIHFSLLFAMILLSACPAAAPGGAGSKPAAAPANGQPEPAHKHGAPQGRLFPEDKSPLKFSKEIEGLNRHVIGFVFPDGLIAMLAATMKDLQLTEDDLSVVGAVEIGEGAALIPSGVYTVAIDLQNQEEPVSGRLTPIDGGSPIELEFTRNELSVNPERKEEVESFTVQPIIRVDTLCFVFNNNPSYWRYCAAPDSVLSVQNNFENEYGQLVSQMNDVVALLLNNGYLDADNVVTAMTISEMEDPTNTKNCANDRVAAKCGADIAGAPIATFWEDFAQKKDESGGEPFFVTAGVARIFHPINIPKKGKVEPGSYVVDYWFDGEGLFVSATISGLPDSGDAISGQVIPAVPAAFISQNNANEITSQISAWRLGNICCWWQSNCP